MWLPHVSWQGLRMHTCCLEAPLPLAADSCVPLSFCSHFTHVSFHVVEERVWDYSMHVVVSGSIRWRCYGRSIGAVSPPAFQPEAVFTHVYTSLLTEFVMPILISLRGESLTTSWLAALEELRMSWIPEAASDGSRGSWLGSYFLTYVFSLFVADWTTSLQRVF